ncbi:MAG TPA: hypothetical protein VFL47_06935 [Flavisolibacter sp.]|nr:hypothetical protein [Flavisolibacter sp.]
MKPTLLLGCALLATMAAHAQLTLLPYAGFEQSHNKVGYGDALSAADINGNLKAGLKMDYRFKGGHSPFINVTTSPSPVTFAFNNTGSLLHTAQESNLLFRLEGGYQYSSKPIFFGKKSTASKPAAELTGTISQEKRTCGSMTYKVHCGAQKSQMKTAPANQPLNMRLQPSVAFAYIPAAQQAVEQTTQGFNYAAGSWKTAIVPAMGFEFAKGARRLFTLGVFYTSPLSQTNEQVYTLSDGKPYVTNVAPQSSTWGLTLGLPFGTSKSKTAKTQATPKMPQTTEKKQCTRTYYRRCMRLQ